VLDLAPKKVISQFENQGMFDFYEVKKKLLHIIFQKEKGNTLTLLFNHFSS
jgi:predicted RNA binding protein YcfA (HicA-like mRNA interferase family)